MQSCEEQTDRQQYKGPIMLCILKCLRYSCAPDLVSSLKWELKMIFLDVNFTASEAWEIQCLKITQSSWRIFFNAEVELTPLCHSP